jgi:hypothetical protein
MDKRWFLLMGLLVLVGFLVVSGFRSGNVVLNYEKYFKLGDKLSGDLTIGIEQGDRLDVKMPILVSLSKNGTMIASETLTLEEFINLAGIKLDKVSRSGKDFYETVGSYNVPIEKIVSYNFNETGEYEMLFSLLNLDINQITTIKVS